MKKVKWLIYTVAIGLVPFLARFFVYMFTNSLTASYLLNEIDIIAFGLALHVANINELTENYIGDEKGKVTNLGICLFMIIIYGIILGISYIADLDQKGSTFNHLNIKICSLVLSAISLVYSYSLTDNTKNAQ